MIATGQYIQIAAAKGYQVAGAVGFPISGMALSDEIGLELFRLRKIK